MQRLLAALLGFAFLAVPLQAHAPAEIELNAFGKCLYWFASKIAPRRFDRRIVNSRRLGEDVYWLKLKDNSEWVFKEANDRTNPHMEVAAYLISEKLKLGVVPETKMESFFGVSGSMQKFINPHKGTIPLPDIDPRITYLDFLMNNKDRRTIDTREIKRWPLSEVIVRNLMIEEGSMRQFAIDFGLSKPREAREVVENVVIMKRAWHNPLPIFPGKESVLAADAMSFEDWKKVTRKMLSDEDISGLMGQQKLLSRLFKEAGLLD